MKDVKGFNLKTKMTEFTLGEFDRIVDEIDNDNLIDKYFKIFSILGMPNEIIDTIGALDIFDIINEFNKDGVVNKELKKTIEIDGRTYVAYEDEFTLLARDFGLIQGYVKKNPTRWILWAIAVIFKDETITRNEHYSEAHIRHKMNLFKDLITDDYYTYIIYIQHNIIKKIESLYDK